MKLTAICNAGILMEYADSALLIDGISRDYAGFSGLDDRIYEKILRKEGKFSKLSGLLFTHCHPDHYDQIRVRAAQTVLQDCEFWIPDERTSSHGAQQFGDFFVSYDEAAHMPYTSEAVRHFVFLIKAGMDTVYLASDSVPDAEVHRKILGDIRPDYIFVNPMHVANPGIKTLLHELSPKRIFCYHLPTDPDDRIGMRRKAVRMAARDYQKTVPVTLVTEHPMYLGEV